MDVVLAIDIGSTQMAVGLMTMTGELIDLARDDVNPDLDAEGVFDALQALVDAQIERATEHHEVTPVVVGVGAAGVVTENCEIVSPPNIRSWRGFPLRSRLQQLTTLPVYGDLDAKALALAEGWVGAAQGRSNFMAMVVAAGVGGGIVIDGQLLDGATGNAGHIGHVIVEPSGRRCTCGARGCLEAEVSGPAIEAITGRSPTEPTYDIMVRTGRLVGRGVASVCNALDLDLVVVGGSVALGFGATFFNAAQDSLSEHCRLSFVRGVRITPARLGDRGPVIGAGAIGLRGLRRGNRSAANARS